MLNKYSINYVNNKDVAKEATIEGSIIVEVKHPTDASGKYITLTSIVEYLDDASKNTEVDKVWELLKNNDIKNIEISMVGSYGTYKMVTIPVIASLGFNTAVLREHEMESNENKHLKKCLDIYSE